MLPSIETTDYLTTALLAEQKEKTETFAIHMKENIVSGTIDDLAALQQSIYLTLSIEADQYIIYPHTYGLKTIDLIGEQPYYIRAILTDRIKDALLRDDRITDVTNFEFENNKNKMHVTFTVSTIYGAMNVTKVVSY
jgi:hypothetical protein